MDTISSIRELINLWPTRAELANDLNIACASLRASAAQVHKWAEKGSIPSKYHHHVLTSGQARGFAISAALLVSLHAPQADDIPFAAENAA